MITPSVVIFPILFPSVSVNQRLPSGPVAMPSGWPGAVGIGNSVITPAVVMRPILLPSCSVNQMLPSGPTVMVSGRLAAVGTGNSVKTPAGVILPILLPTCSANQRFPSGPVTIPSGSLPSVGMGVSVMTWPHATRAMPKAQRAAITMPNRRERRASMRSESFTLSERGSISFPPGSPVAQPGFRGALDWDPAPLFGVENAEPTALAKKKQRV